MLSRTLLLLSLTDLSITPVSAGLAARHSGAGADIGSNTLDTNLEDSREKKYFSTYLGRSLGREERRVRLGLLQQNQRKQQLRRRTMRRKSMQARGRRRRDRPGTRGNNIR